MAQKVSKRTCKNKFCKVKFTPVNNGQVVHQYSCGIEYAKQLRERKEKQEGKDLRKKNKEAEIKLRSRTGWLKILERHFNEYIRLRDRLLPCISCGATTGVQWSAGHYFPTTHGSVRFNEFNVNKQCWMNCNKSKHGNLAEYLPNLILKIGQKAFDEMARIKNQEKLHLSVPEIKEQIEIYKNKVKELK